MAHYTLVSNGDFQTITALIDGELYTADNKHPNFIEILTALVSDQPESASAIVDKFDVGAAIQGKFDVLGERVTIRGANLYFDGDVIAGPIVDQILRFHQDGSNFQHLVSFLEKVQNNPQDESRESLYRWLTATGGFTINEEGNILGYKGVAPGENSGEFLSISRGYAVVDGEEVNGQVPQKIGSVVTMPRSKVAFDPSEACSTGLHVGTWDYASNFGRGVVLTVEVDPRDVVSVPTDCNGQKMRVCRYTVVDAVDSPHPPGLYSSYDDDYDVDDEGYDEPEIDFGEVEDYEDGARVEDRGGAVGTVIDYNDTAEEYRVEYDDPDYDKEWLTVSDLRPAS